MSETKMDYADAEAEAKRRFGPRGAVTVWPLEVPSHSHSVGVAQPFCLGRAFHERGCGASFEEAFKDSDRPEEGR